MTTVNASIAPAPGGEIISESGGAIISEQRGGFVGIGSLIVMEACCGAHYLGRVLGGVVLLLAVTIVLAFDLAIIGTQAVALSGAPPLS